MNDEMKQTGSRLVLMHIGATVACASFLAAVAAVSILNQGWLFFLAAIGVVAFTFWVLRRSSARAIRELPISAASRRYLFISVWILRLGLISVGFYAVTCWCFGPANGWIVMGL